MYLVVIKNKMTDIFSILKQAKVPNSIAFGIELQNHLKGFG